MYMKKEYFNPTAEIINVCIQDIILESMEGNNTTPEYPVF